MTDWCAASSVVIVEVRFEGGGPAISVTKKVVSSPKVALPFGAGSSLCWVAIIIGLAAFAFFS